MNPEVPSFDPNPDDERLEKLLRADAARDAYIEDAGFTAAVMAALPPPQRVRSYSWLGPLMGGLAVALVVCFSPLLTDLLGSLLSLDSHALQTALRSHLLPQGLLLLAPLAALVYGAAWFAATDSESN
jgi:hypothetical protein